MRVNIRFLIDLDLMDSRQIRIFGTFVWLLMLSHFSLASFAQEIDAIKPASPAATSSDARAEPTDERIDLQKKLAKYLTSTRWTGKFTLTGADGPPKAEHYEILSAEKAEEGDYWNLVVRIKYGEHDMTMPLPPIEIKWAGETPVITVDQVTIPALGTFDARVVIRGGQYAGVWKHDAVGGHLFGKIEKIVEGEEKRGDEQK